MHLISVQFLSPFMLGIDHIERCNKRNQWPGSMRGLQKQTLSRLSDAAANNHTHTHMLAGACEMTMAVEADCFQNSSSISASQKQ